jgi:hypothetical protein
LIRGLFEAFVIYEFFSLLIHFLGENDQELHRALANKPLRTYPYPLCCIALDPASPHFINDRRIGAIQVRFACMSLSVLYQIDFILEYTHTVTVCGAETNHDNSGNRDGAQ